MLHPHSHRPGGSWGLLLVVAAGAAGWGCASEEIPKYGDPAQVAGGVGGSDTGTSPGGAGGSGGGTGGACTPDMGCAVKFSTDIYPVLNDKGGCASASGCHGTGVGELTLDASVESYFTALNAFSLADGKYIVPCDPPNSKILCNLKVSGGDQNPNGSCGVGMPFNPADGPTLEDLQKIEDWIACGAPNN